MAEREFGPALSLRRKHGSLLNLCIRVPGLNSSRIYKFRSPSVSTYLSLLVRCRMVMGQSLFVSSSRDSNAPLIALDLDDVLAATNLAAATCSLCLSTSI